MFKGRVWKSKKFWLIEVSALDVMTQGRSKKDAYDMLEDALLGLVDRKGFKVDIAKYSNNTFHLSGRDEDSNKDLIALMFRRQRAKHNISLREMKELIGAKSNDSYARYEQGRQVPAKQL